MIEMKELQKLRHLSARVGADPLLVQAAGGNTSLKADGVMWIKASGTWLKDAIEKDIFVPVDHAALMQGLAVRDPACESCEGFVRQDLSAKSLRPSIETTVHALMPQSVVVHVHCVNTISWAIQDDAEIALASKLQEINWAFIPYARPGLFLADAIAERLRPAVDVLVLGNHGLVVAAETVEEAERLLARVVEILQRPERPYIEPDLVKLASLADGTDYIPSSDAAIHALATDATVLDRCRTSVLYPDHVVFLGVGVATDLTTQAPLVAVPGVGVLVHRAAKPAVEPMGRCLADVLRRLPAHKSIRKLNDVEIDMLVNWDAEKYRQTLSSKDV